MYVVVDPTAKIKIAYSKQGANEIQLNKKHEHALKNYNEFDL